MYFFGTFEHSIDERGRLAIPARYRRAFVDGGVLRPSPDGALELYTYQSFDSEATRRIESGNGNQTAIIWEGNNPDESISFTFSELLYEVPKFSNVLKNVYQAIERLFENNAVYSVLYTY